MTASSFSIHLDSDRSENSVTIDGVEVSASIVGLHLTGAADDISRLVIEYSCISRVDAGGWAKVIHQCPLRDES